MCRRLAAITFGPDDSAPALGVGGDWDSPLADPETACPPRMVDVSAPAVLDRHVLRWTSEAFYAAARQLVGKACATLTRTWSLRHGPSSATAAAVPRHKHLSTIRARDEWPRPAGPRERIAAGRRAFSLTFLPHSA
jgi:hypothetical protein